jgi:hypothetical protein
LKMYLEFQEKILTRISPKVTSLTTLMPNVVLQQ